MATNELHASILRRLQEGALPAVIADETGASRWTVRAVARAGGVVLSKSVGLKAAYARGDHATPRHRYTVDDSYFERPLTPTGAWVLGVIAGDGCITQRKGVVQALDIVGDADVLQKIAAELGSNYPFRQLQGVLDLRIYSSRLARSLAHYGFGPAKTYTLPFPELPEGLIRHFVRGYWDADGCVTRTKRANGGARVSLVAVTTSREFADALSVIVRRVTGSKAVPSARRVMGAHPAYSVQQTAAMGVRFGRWMWDDTTPAMRGDRKHARFREMMDGPAGT